MTLILAFFLTWMHAAHPVHVSVTNLEVDRNKREIAITQKLYTEDYSLLFYHLYEKNVRFIAGKDLTEGELSVIEGYMNTAFYLEVGEKRLPMTYAGKEQDEESIWMHYSCKLPEDISSVTLTNNVLLALFEDQTNLVIVSAGQAQKGYTFTVDKWKYDLDLSLQ
jgi:hypothetical protein